MSAQEVTLLARMQALKAALAALYPARVVTRSFVDLQDRTRTELAAGVYTIMSAREEGYANYVGREAMDAQQKIFLIGQFQLAEDASGEQIEDAEFTLVEEIKAFVRTVPPELCALEMVAFDQSMQIERPFGWVVIELRYGP